MFTGVIQGLGILGGRRGGVLRVEVPPFVCERLKEGASIAVSGVCLTARELEGEAFLADLSPETSFRTTLGELRTGARLNLELPVSPDGLLDGHLVLGHVDTVGRVKAIRPDSDGWRFTFSYPPEWRRHLVEKGSIAVDGISLTPFSITGTTFQCAIIPHTFEKTTLNERSVGDAVNLEFDILAKYVAEVTGRAHTD
jgi:riboflavin synthase